jgi:hypothetical protein
VGFAYWIARMINRTGQLLSGALRLCSVAVGL